jgi:hypothetical protein
LLWDSSSGQSVPDLAAGPLRATAFAIDELVGEAPDSESLCLEFITATWTAAVECVDLIRRPWFAIDGNCETCRPPFIRDTKLSDEEFQASTHVETEEMINAHCWKHRA